MKSTTGGRLKGPVSAQPGSNLTSGKGEVAGTAGAGKTVASGEVSTVIVFG